MIGSETKKSSHNSILLWHKNPPHYTVPRIPLWGNNQESGVFFQVLDPKLDHNSASDSLRFRRSTARVTERCHHRPSSLSRPSWRWNDWETSQRNACYRCAGCKRCDNEKGCNYMTCAVRKSMELTRPLFSADLDWRDFNWISSL